MKRDFTPSRLERIAYYAKLAGDEATAKEAEREFYREGTEGDCCHEYAG